MINSNAGDWMNNKRGSPQRKYKAGYVKQLLAWIIIFCLSMNIFPVDVASVLAEAVSAIDFNIDLDGLPEYEIMDNGIQGALVRIEENVEEGQTEKEKGLIVLQDDYTENLVINDMVSVVIDLNGHTIRPQYGTLDENHITVYGELKIIDSQSSGAIISDSENDKRAITVVNGGKLVLQGCRIENYYCSGNGAAIRVEENGYMNFIDSAISGCRSDLQGGAIYAYHADSVEMNGGELFDNSAQNGGAIAFYKAEKNGEESLSSFENLSIHSNTASSNGGGIFVDNAINLDLINSTISENTANAGGGIYFGGSTNLNLTECSIKNNTAVVSHGGGIFFYAASNINGSSLVSDKSEFIGNVSQKGSGGGIFFSTALTKTRNVVDLKETKISGNVSNSNGGGMYLYSKVDLTIDDKTEITNNSAENRGGGFYLYGYQSGSDISIITLNGGKISDNTLTAVTNTKYGAGIYTGRSVRYNLNYGDISRNTNAYQGGGIYSEYYCSLYIHDGIVISDNVTYSQNDVTYGAGICISNSCKVYMDGGEITGNHADGCGLYGAGVYASSGSNTFIMSGGKITDNNGTQGGGIYMRGTTEIGGTSNIANNRASSDGGGVFQDGGKIDIIDRAVIENNKAGGWGGGVRTNVNVEMRNEPVIRNNTASNGGGICVYHPNAKAFIKGGQIINNYTSSNGGGMYIYSNSPSKLTGGEISGNEADYGGGVFVNKYNDRWYDSAAEVYKPYLGPSVEVSTNMSINNNTARTSGGGVYLSAITRLELYEGGRITGNIAKSSGGGVCAAGNSFYDFVSARDNTEHHTEALYVEGGELHDNSANSSGRDIYVSESASPDKNRPYYVPSYMVAPKASDMENASAGSYWVDEVEKTNVYTALSNKEKVDNQQTPKYSAYTFNNVVEETAQIGTIIYPTVQDAVNAIANGEAEGNDIILLHSNRETITIPDGVEASLDLQGNTLYGESVSVIKIDTGGKLTLKDTVGGGKITEGKGIIYTDGVRCGGAVFVDGIFEMESGIISNNNAKWGSAIYVNKNAEFTMTGGTIENNFLAGNDSNTSAVEVRDGSVDISNATITNNKCFAVRIIRATHSEIKNSVISKSYTAGRAVYVDSTNGFILRGCTIENNVLSGEGMVYITIGNSNKAYISDNIIRNNKANNSAGIRLQSGILYLENNEITNNSATSGSPGGVYCYNNSTLYYKNNKIYNNKSTSNGPDLYLSQNVNWINDSDDGTDYRAVENSGLTDYNCWYDEGKNAYFVENKEAHNSDLAVFYNITDMFTDIRYPNRTSSSSYSLRADISPDTGEPVAEIVDTGLQYSTLSSALASAARRDDADRVTVRLLKDVSEQISLTESIPKLTLDLNGHTVTSLPGAMRIFYLAAMDFTLDDSAGGGKITPFTGENADISMTRAFRLEGVKFTLKGGEISGFNLKGAGSAIYATGAKKIGTTTYTTDLYIKGGSIINNTSTGDGGAIYFETAANANNRFEMTGGSVCSNTGSRGGAIFFVSTNKYDGAKYYFIGGTIAENTAKSDGGGFYYTATSNNANYSSLNCEMIIYGCEMKNNLATTQGGAFFCYFAPCNTEYPFIIGNDVVHTEFSGNRSNKDYSVGYVNSTTKDTKGIIVKNVEVKDNYSSSSNVLRCCASTVTVKNTTVHDNRSGGSSTALSVAAGEMLIENCEFYNNNARSTCSGLLVFTPNANVSEGNKLVKDCKIYNNKANYGAGLWDSSLYDVTYQNCEFYDNYSYTGGALVLYNENNNKTERTKYFKDCYIHNNKALSYGGAFYSYNLSYLTLDITDTEISHNTSSSYGGAFSFEGTTNRVILNEGAVVSDNTAVYGGGFNLTACLELNGGRIENNTATTNGGGIYTSTDGVKPIYFFNSGYITGNKAASNGGGIYYEVRGDQADRIYQLHELTGGIISNNTANNGGGMFIGTYWGNGNTSPNVTISGAKFIGNHANANGGAIYNSTYVRNTEIKDNAIITGNTAGNVGGGLFVENRLTSVKVLEGGRLYGNKATQGNDAYCNQSNSYRNSNLFLVKPSNMFADGDELAGSAWLEERTGATTTESVKIRPLSRAYPYTLQYHKVGAVVAVYNGAEYGSVQEAMDAAAQTPGKDGEIIMVSDSTESITVPAELNVKLNLNGYMLEGGGVAAVTNRGKLTVVDEKKSVTVGDKTYDPGNKDGYITGSASEAGGGINIMGGTVTLKSGKIKDCYAGANSDNVRYGGGAVAVTSGEFILDGGTICDNIARRGAAVLVRGSSGRFTMLSGKICRNGTSTQTANTSYGYGAVFNNGGTVTIVGGEISENEAQQGGAFYNNSGVMSISGSSAENSPVITRNKAGQRGGALYVAGGTVVTTNAVFTYNQTTAAKSTEVNTENGLCTSAGGAAFVFTGTLNIGDGTRIENNKAVRGGAIYQRQGNVQIDGTRTVITKNVAVLGGGCAQIPIPGNATTYMSITNGSSVYDNKSTLTSAGNDFYSAWEGSNRYEQQLGSHADYTPRLTLRSASEMAVGDRYNVWKNDNYKGTNRIGDTLVDGQFVRGEVTLGNNIQITAAYYKTDFFTSLDSNFRIVALSVLEVADGSGNMDNGQTIGEIIMDNAGPSEKTAKNLLDANTPGVTLSNITYKFNNELYNYIEVNGKLYEQNQMVEWWAGDDSSINNLLVRSFDTIHYNINVAHEFTLENERIEDRNYYGHICIKAVLPCSSEKATFYNLANDGIHNAVITPSVDANGNPIQILTGYVETVIKPQDVASGNDPVNLSIDVRGMTNGQTIKPTLEVWFEGNNTDAHAYNEAETITVSAAPKYNVTLLSNDKLTHTGFFDMINLEEISIELEEGEPVPENIVYGTMLGFGITVELYNDPNIKGKRGLEIPEDGLEFDLSLNGKLYNMGGTVIEGATGKPIIWGYKENNSSEYGRQIGSSIDDLNMSWNDYDDRTKYTHYAYNAAPFNSGGDNKSCFDGGGWWMTEIQPDKTDEIKVHIKVDRYVFDSSNNPICNSDGVQSELLKSEAVKAFSAGYVEAILPYNQLQGNERYDGYFQAYMDAVVTNLNVRSATGQLPGDIEGASDFTEEKRLKDLAAMNEYYGFTDPEQLVTDGYAVNERRYADNYVAVKRSLILGYGGKSGEKVSKHNLFNDADNHHINGADRYNDTGEGQTPLGSTVFIEGGMQYSSATIDPTDPNTPYYIDPESDDYDSSLIQPVEYKYITALNILQKFDAEAFTPYGTSKPILNQPNGAKLNQLLENNIKISIDEVPTTWSDTATTSYKLTVLYAARPPAGDNWEMVHKTDTAVTPNIAYKDSGAADMDKYHEENLIYFETLNELHEYLGADAQCVAVLYQFRDCCIRNKGGATVYTKMKVTGEFEKVGQTYCTTNDVRAWTTYRPTYKKYFALGNSVVYANTYNYVWQNMLYDTKVYGAYGENTLKVYGKALPPEQHFTSDEETYQAYTENEAYKDLIEVYTAPAHYIKTRYRNGTTVGGTHNGMQNGNSILLYSIDTSIQFNVYTKIAHSNTVKKDYVITNGEREVRYRATPSIHIASSAVNTPLVRNGTQSAQIEISFNIPEYLHYKNGSIFFDYSHSKYKEGDLNWEVEVDEVPDGNGKATITVKTLVSDIELELPEIFFDCGIGDPEDASRDVKYTGTSLTINAGIFAKYSEQNMIAAQTHYDSDEIVVKILSQDGVTKEVDEKIVELGEDLVYTLHYGNTLNSASYGLEIADILPHNDDGRKTNFYGGYAVKSVQVTFDHQNDFNEFVKPKTDDNGETSDAEICGMIDFGNNNKTWSSTFSQSTSQMTALLEEIKDDLVENVSCQIDADHLCVTYDFSDKNLGTNAYDNDNNPVRSAPALYAYVPKVSGESRVTIKVILSPIRSGHLIESGNDSTKNKTQIGGCEYYNSFFFRKSVGDITSGRRTSGASVTKPHSSVNTTVPLTSNIVSISVVNRVLSGVVWLDRDQDGLYNTVDFVNYNNKLANTEKKEVEYPISGITASLYRIDDNNDRQPAYDVLGNPVQPVKTDTDGNYKFENLPEGDFIVVFGDPEDEYQINYGNSVYKNEKKHPLPFSKLSVTALDNSHASRANKCEPDYSPTDKAKLETAFLERYVSMPNKQVIPVAQYSSPNWNLGLYFVDLDVKKQWENMIYGIAENTSVTFDIVGRESLSEDIVYEGTLVMTNEDGSVKGWLTENSGEPQEMAIETKSNVNTRVYNWNLAPTIRVFLQAQNELGEIDYTIEERSVSANGKPVDNYFNRFGGLSENSINKKQTYSIINSQILGSVTILKHTGAGDALDGAQFGIYQVPTEKSEDDQSFYGATEGLNTTYTSDNRYDVQTTKAYYKVILGNERNLSCLTNLGRYVPETKLLTVPVNSTVNKYYKVHKELYNGQERYYYYTPTNETYTFTYDLIFGGRNEYDTLRDEGIIDVNDKYEHNGQLLSVYRRRIDLDTVEFYSTITVNPRTFSTDAVLEFKNLPLYDSQGNAVFYTVRETAFPKGFTSLADFNSLTGMNLFDHYTDNSGSYVHDLTFDVENTKLMKLPVTGGSGLWGTVFCGTFIVTLCVAYLYLSAKRKKRSI